MLDFEPYAKKSDVPTLGNLSIENRVDRITLHGRGPARRAASSQAARAITVAARASCIQSLVCPMYSSLNEVRHLANVAPTPHGG